MSMQDFDYFLVLDFEATCDDSIRIHPQVMYKQAPKHNKLESANNKAVTLNFYIF